MVDTTNKFLVSVANDGIVLMRPPQMMQIISLEDALNLAAYLVALADHDNKFYEVLVAVKNS